MLKFNYLQEENIVKSQNLNTSHVKVQPGVSKTGIIEIKDLNTSHVKVQPLRKIIKILQIPEFKYISC